jgi:hypothetical protein
MPDSDHAAAISNKLNVLISLALRQLQGNADFSAKGPRPGVTDAVRYLANMGLEAKDIAEIVGSPVTSVRTLLTPGRRK